MEYMDVEEFIDGGYLLEINRRMLHPIGLALEVNFETGILSVQDHRDDPEGVIFEIENDDHLIELREKQDKYYGDWRDREFERVKGLGFMVQPLRVE